MSSFHRKTEAVIIFHCFIFSGLKQVYGPHCHLIGQRPAVLLYHLAMVPSYGHQGLTVTHTIAIYGGVREKMPHCKDGQGQQKRKSRLQASDK